MECTVKFGSCRQSWARYYKIWNKCLKIEIVYKGENTHMIYAAKVFNNASNKILCLLMQDFKKVIIIFV